MKDYKEMLKNLDKKIGDPKSVRRYNLSDMISESYKSFYDCKEGSNLQKLAEAHLQDVRENPSDIDRLSRQLSQIKEALSMNLDDSKLFECDSAPVPSHRFRRSPKMEAKKVCPDCGKSPCVCESMNEEDDPELTDEEVDELAKHLESIRKNRKAPIAKKEVEEGCGTKKPMKEESAPRRGIRCMTHKSIDEVKDPSPELQDHIMTTLADIIYDFGVEPDDLGELLDELVYNIAKMMPEQNESKEVKESTTINGETPRYAVIKPNGQYAGKFCISYEEAKDLAAQEEGRVIFKLIDEEENGEFFESKKVTESYKGLESFSKNSSSKAFYKTFKKMHESLKEGKALTRQESMNLYKAANSAMTQLSVELEHNPKFLSTFNECTTLLSADVNKLLESMKKDKAPSKNTMKSLAKFSEALLNEGHSEEWFKDAALDYMYGEDRDMDNSKYSEEEIKKALDYYFKKHPDQRMHEADEADDKELISSLINQYEKKSPMTKGAIYDELIKEYGNKVASAVSKACGDDPKINEAEEDEEDEVEDDDEFVGDDEGDVQSAEADDFDQEYADARVEMHKELADKHGDSEDPEVQEKIAQDAAEVTSLPGITDDQIAEITGESEETEEAPEEEPADDEVTDDELAELKKHLKEMREAKRLGEALITDFLPEDKLRSEFSKHGMEILSFEQGNLVKVKTKNGTKILCKVVKNDDGEFEVFNPDYKREFIIKK